MAEWHIGEIFSSIQGEGLYVGRRQLFVRLAGCSWSCVYCDSRDFRSFSPPYCRVEISPGSGRFRRVSNPLSADETIGHLKKLWTPDIHSVSLTGGEPLLSGEFLVELARACRENGFRTYLETNGCSSTAMERVLPYIDIASVDIKMPDHLAVPRVKWAEILGEELRCIELAAGGSVDVFAKMVIMSSTGESALNRVFHRLAPLGVPLVLQPVTGRGRVRPPSFERICRISEMASRSGIRETAIIPQVHRLMGVL
ncbi:MAG: 7-carboxy-7-deazaguanine synthase QueE [Candidatus Hadarchaeales archaeon]